MSRTTLINENEIILIKQFKFTNCSSVLTQKPQNGVSSYTFDALVWYYINAKCGSGLHLTTLDNFAFLISRSLSAVAALLHTPPLNKKSNERGIMLALVVACSGSCRKNSKK